ncbi:MAG: hypothetical protein ABI551_03845 [Polyangiaceae bacterium]
MIDDRTLRASPLLLAAAVGGLLSACSSPSSGPQPATNAEVEGGTEVEACDAGVVDDPAIMSMTTGAMSEADFTARCDSAHGVVQVEPHCGGNNQCRGFSYDSKTQALTENTCRATNTCGGFSCIVCD